MTAAPKPLDPRAAARVLALQQLGARRGSTVLPVASGPALSASLEAAHRTLRAARQPGPGHSTAVCWYLDNYYLIRRVARQVEDEMPRGFVRQLPRIEAGAARIESVAVALVTQADLALDPDVLRECVEAYQEVAPLTIAELWALPTMLRAATLRRLVQAVENLESGAAVVERAVRALRVLDALDWKIFFVKTSRVEEILRTDPAGVYPRMDFATCDAYRKVVEALACGSAATEPAVAQAAVDLAAAHRGGDRRGHVGYYLVAGGRAALEEQLGYRAAGIERVRRAVLAWPTLAYLLPLALLTWLPVLGFAVYLAPTVGWDPWLPLAVAVLVGVIPASSVATTLLHYGFARLLVPRILPKLDFAKGLPDELRTLVVMPTLLGRSDDVAAMLRQIELHYLSNPDPNLQFALLTDDVDAIETRPPEALSALLDAASRGIERLNAEHGTDGHGPFHLLHRDPRWNAREQRFMGWERKRGKLKELNRFLRGDAHTSFGLHVGEPSGLTRIHFVITLDSDTQLPMEAAHRMVGLLAHPLNQAVFDDAGRVVSGYTIVQPRIDTSPASARNTLFSRLFAGDVGLDIYTHASSELYQDLFGAGVYVGKGIYDVDAFMRSVGGRVPENALVSHDLFEGIYGRTGLATDIVLFESYPSAYTTYALRMHRWVRGDWQLAPWLFPSVPAADGLMHRNELSAIDRWKIADNLRRSVTAPALLVLMVLGWTWLPGPAWAWTLGTLAVVFAPFVLSLGNVRRTRLETLGRYALSVVMLAHVAWTVLDAIVRVAVRTHVTRRNLLEWTSAAHAAFGAASRASRPLFWRSAIASPLLAIAIASLLARQRPASFGVAAPFLLAWFFAPELARWVSRTPRFETERITDAQRRRLRLLARRTWRFFDAFVGPEDQWLPIDNYQDEPHPQCAHRTSPTNIGMMLVSTLTAYDFGYVGASELSLRLRRTFDSMDRLERYRGHLFNWYDTRNRQALAPRYVSTVDSGNLAGCLLALGQGCLEAVTAPVARTEAWEGLEDSLGLLAEVVAEVPKALTGPLREVLARMQREAAHAHDRSLVEASRTLARLRADAESLDVELLSFLESRTHRHEADLLAGLRTTLSRLHGQLEQMQRELDMLLPWIALESDAAWHAVVFPHAIRVDEVADTSRQLHHALALAEEHRRQQPGSDPALAASADRLLAAFECAERNATALAVELQALAARAHAEVAGMDFSLLYDAKRRLFRIGYDATSDQLDPNFYDLLASEARLASFIAIVKRDVPETHWFALGRQMTQGASGPLLLSWGGTMFEYLMPSLLMRSRPGTLLERSCALAVEAQIAHGNAQHQPWGISESAYARVDADHTYQYRSFGVPALGFKRGLDADHVVSSYASLLAVAIAPRAVLANLDVLEARGMLGTYGLFEALDLTAERVNSPSGTVVRSYMAHHQGMLFVALGNLLTRRSMVDRFHADARVETGELLLNERAPDVIPAEWPDGSLEAVRAGPVAADVAPEVPAPRAPAPWLAPPHCGPQAFALGNGNLSSVLTASGGGGLRWHELALTRFEPDATHDADGLWIYVRDEETGSVWQATSAEGRTTFAQHKVEFHQRQDGISVHVDVAVAPADDVEVRQVTLHNESDRVRIVTLTSAARPVLLDARQAPTHPAFSSLFVESEVLAEMDAVLCARRPQSAEQRPAVLVHRLVHEGAAVTFGRVETDRGAFFGRNGSVRAPRSLVEGVVEASPSAASLDPVMSLSARIIVPARGSVKLAFVTSVARSRTGAVELARKYGTMHAVRWAFRDADQDGARRLQRLGVEPELVPTIQRMFSALLFGPAALRVPAAQRALTPPCQRRLWGRGISGDEPIVLVRVDDAGAALIRDVLLAQIYLRSCGVSFDLVLIDRRASGYASEAMGTLRSLLVQCEVDAWIDRHGGIFLVAADQVPDEELGHLEACARILLDTRDGTLHARLDRRHDERPLLPRFEATRVDDTTAQPMPRPASNHDNGVGGFSEDGREYVLELVPGAPVPAPWCNVLANPDFGCLVSESSFGTSWSQNSGENRLTPWRNDAVLDTPSEALYLRDEETAAVWSTTPLPAGQGASVRVRHGAGYTIYERESHGLVQELTVFVPTDASLKVVRLCVTNTLPRHRRLTATYYAEWVLGNRREKQRPHVVAALEREHACLLATCGWNAEFGERVAFLAASHPLHGFGVDRAEFLGPRGDYARPAALERWGLSGAVDAGNDPCAALQVHLDLAAGARLETHFVLGQAATRGAALELVAQFRNGDTVDRAFHELGVFWDRMLGAVRVKTPEPAMDLLLNRWLLYQTLSARVFGRTGFYQSSGAFGYRDQLQDMLALLQVDPARTRAHILEAATHQFEEGDVLHWWHPPSGRGVRTRCSDDLAWLPYVTGEYVAATGDRSILDVEVPFLHGAPLQPGEHDRYAQYEGSAHSASLLEHCRRALTKAATAGAHGLPLMGDGDWNDGMSRVGSEGRGESVWLGWFLCATMDRFAALARGHGHADEADAWGVRAAALRVCIADVAWDGAWYRRAFHDDGSMVGSQTSHECRIDSIAQSWAVLSGGAAAANAKARTAVQSAETELVREAERLVLLFWPPYDSARHDPGYVRAYPPGVRENGGQYTHASTWLGMAHAALGDGARATRIFRLLNPILRTQTPADVARYRIEPYVLAGDVYACAPWVGRGGWSWYTGAAAWMWRLGVESILGISTQDAEVVLEPCIPPEWPGFEAWITRGAQTLHVVVENPDGVSRGVASMTVDARAVDSNRLALDPTATGTREVRIRLGAGMQRLGEPPADPAGLHVPT